MWRTRLAADNDHVRCRRLPVLSFAVMLAALPAPAYAKEKAFTLPPVLHARSYPAHDEHANEHVTIGADAYGRDKSSIFSTDYQGLGFAE